MDPLTEKLLERARARRENLARKMAESNMSPRKTATSTVVPVRVPLRENQLHNLEPKVSPMKGRREETLLKPDTPAIPSVKSRLHRLAEQRQVWNASNPGGTEVDSPQNVIPPKRPDFEEEEKVSAAPAPKAPASSRSRFAALAANINSWEDDTNHPRHRFDKEKPATRKWQPPQRPETAEDSTPVAAKRSAPTTLSQTSSTETTAPSSTQPSPPKRTKYEEKESMLQREQSGKGKAQFKSIPYRRRRSSTGSVHKVRSPSIKKLPSKIVHDDSSQLSSSFKTVITVRSSKHSPVKKPKSPLSGRLFVAVGTRRQTSLTSDDSDSSAGEQPVPAPRAAKTDAPAARSPIKMHVTTASPVKRPTPQSCTPATPKIESPRKQANIRESPKKAATVTTTSTIKQRSPIKNSLVKQHTSPVKQVTKTKNTPIVKRGPTSQKFAQAMALLEQGCGGGGASSRQSPVKTTPRVGAMAQRIQQRLKADQNNWQGNAINKKIQEERQKEMALIKARWEGSGTGSHGPKEEPKSSSTHKEEEEEEENDGMSQDQDVDTEEEEEEMDAESNADADVSESNVEDDYSTEEDEMQSQEEMADIIPITMERSSAPTNDRLDDVIVDAKNPEKADESELNISDVLGDIDELIVEAEQAMKDEEQAKSPKKAAVLPTQATTPKADLSGWDYNIDKMEPIYANIEEMTNSASSSSSQDEGNPTPAPRHRRRSSSVGSIDSCISAASSMAPISLESYRSQQQQKTLSPTTVTHRTVTRETASRSVVRDGSSSSRPRASSTSSAASSALSSRSGGNGGRHQHQQQGSQHTRDQRRLVAKMLNTKEKIQTLMEEVSAQQSIIHQTSQALELIAATEEYHGTKEEIEAERLLVVATQRRQACLSEIQYLKNPVTAPKVIMTEDGEEIVPCRGSVTIKDIRLPLKTQYLMALDSGRDQAHHSFFVIVRCQEHVIATQILSTREISGDCLHFTNLVCLNDLGSDFTIDILVYEMRGRCATIDAVHSKKASTSKHGWSLTPKKFRQGGRYPQSPGPSGHSTVRQNSFATVGSVRLTLASSQLKKCTLTKVPFLSPLEGAIHMTMSCHTDSQTHAEGFLTMFDDCSGLGMWHRRWCVLHGGNLSFWKYPGDEKRKPPIGTIDLKSCITREVKMISRIHCARPNTFELQTSRPASKSDRDTLVSKHTNSYTVTKHLLSADTKEDRVEWTTSLNKTLLELRLWCKDAVRPSHQ